MKTLKKNSKHLKLPEKVAFLCLSLKETSIKKESDVFDARLFPICIYELIKATKKDMASKFT
jgi:hypothetical protein